MSSISGVQNGTIEVSFTFPRESSNDTTCCVMFSKSGKVIDVINPKVKKSKCGGVAMFTNSEEAFSLNQQIFKLEENLEPHSSSSTLGTIYKAQEMLKKDKEKQAQEEEEHLEGKQHLYVINENALMNFNSGSRQATIVFIWSADFSNKDKGSEDSAKCKMHVSRTKLPFYDAEQYMVDLLCFRYASLLRKDQSDKKIASQLSSILTVSEEIKTSDKFLMMGFAKYGLASYDFEVSKKPILNQFKVNDELANIYKIHEYLTQSNIFDTIIDKSKVFTDFEMRPKQHICIGNYSEVGNTLKACFSWNTVGRTFVIDLACIVFNEAGYIVDFLLHDRNMSMDNCIMVKQILDANKPKFYNYEVDIDLSKISEQYHTIVFVSSIFAESISYMRVKDSKMIVKDMSGNCFGHFTLGDSLESTKIWAKISRVDADPFCKDASGVGGYRFECIDVSVNSKNYGDALSILRDLDFVPFNPLKSCRTLGYTHPYSSIEKEEDNEEEDSPPIISKFLHIKYRSCEGKDSTDSLSGPPAIQLLLFSTDPEIGARCIGMKTVKFPPRMSHVVYEPETMCELDFKNIDNIFIVIPNVFSSIHVSTLIFLNSNNQKYDEVCRVEVFDEDAVDRFEEGSIASFITARLQKIENTDKWSIHAVQKFMKNDVESWTKHIYSNILKNRKSPTVPILADNEVQMFSGSEVVVGAKNSKGSKCQIKVYTYDYFNNVLGVAEQSNPTCKCTTPYDREKVIVNWSQGYEMPVLGEDNQSQAMLYLLNEGSKCRSFVFVAEISNRDLIAGDKIFLHFYDPMTKRELYRAETVFASSKQFYPIAMIYNNLQSSQNCWSIKKFGTVSDTIEELLPPLPSKIRINMIRGTQIPELDSVIDSYLEFKDGKTLIEKTDSKKKTREPEWKKEFDYAVPNDKKKVMTFNLKNKGSGIGNLSHSNIAKKDIELLDICPGKFLFDLEPKAKNSGKHSYWGKIEVSFQLQA